MEQGGDEPGLPIVRVDDVRRVLGDRAARDRDRALGQCREPQPVVRPLPAVGAEVGIAGPCEQMGRVENEEVDAGRMRAEHSRRSAVQCVERVDGLGPVQRIDDRRIARNQRAHRDALARERHRQRADDVRETAGLDERVDLGRNREDVHSPLHVAAVASRSIIGCVMRQTPSGVRRKRAASSSGSSPTTSPSGIFTSASMITLASRAPRPISA